MRYQSPPSDHTEQAQQSVQERAEQQRIARREELKVTQADNKRWAANRERVLAERNNENTDVALTPLKEKKKKSGLSSLLCAKPSFSKLPTKTVAYCWVNTKAESGEDNVIPSVEKEHGLLNVISNAKVTPKVKHVIYVDRRTKGRTCYDSRVELPENVKFVSVDELLTKKNMATPAIAKKMTELYEASINYGSPAFAKNMVSLLALNAGDYFFDIGVSIKPDGNLAKHLNGESKFSGGAVGNGSYLMGGHDKEAIEMVVEFLYGLYTCERAPTVHPKKAVEILDNLDKSLTPNEVISKVVDNAKLDEQITPAEFVTYSRKMEKEFAERGVKTTMCEYARHTDAVFGNTITILTNSVKKKFADGTDFVNTHKMSHIHKTKVEAHHVPVL
ncbi:MULTISPECIES: hypothetical protein [Vibrio]|jgi:hypothetical protein|uniref:Uncharacterized protein n=3 Tax=Vibrio harveyi TaxID=669 RepID=A0A8B3DGJ3_VIBHA|nr:MULTISPECIES: hypothetical protein [Vibrio]AWB00400.1 hypothetical protein CU052_14310 [Vibrio harveyi]EKO3808354.1 hypothetical protein [Vibrio harveyi]EKO3847496.1 hypothetical protein [Vibrio harveyi]EMR38153.1 hypothetical protein MUQ_04693 [Vibrio harveyi CAIM 1792]KNY43566.1 hypothetical protein AKG93_10260 [Vibrio harveyi]